MAWELEQQRAAAARGAKERSALLAERDKLQLLVARPHSTHHSPSHTVSLLARDSGQHVALTLSPSPSTGI